MKYSKIKEPNWEENDCKLRNPSFIDSHPNLKLLSSNNLNDEDLKDFIINIDYSKIDSVRMLLDDPKKKYLIRKLVTKFNDKIIARKINLIMNLMDSSFFANLINKIDFCFSDFDMNEELNVFLSFCLNQKNILENSNLLNNSDLLNKVYYFYKTIYLKLGIEISMFNEDLELFKNEPEELLCQLIKDENIPNDKFSEVISEILYNKNLVSLKTTVDEICNLGNKLSYGEMECLKNIVEIISKPTLNRDELISYCKKNRDNNKVLKKLEQDARFNCATDIVKNIFLDIPKDTTYLSGEDFSILTHKLTTYNSSDYYDNICTWKNNEDKDSILSTSFINQHFFGMIPGKQSVLGFKNVDPNLIIDMGLGDIFSDTNIYKRGMRPEESRYSTAEELLYTSSNLYNEVVLKRMNDNKNIEPDFVFCLDKVNKNDKKLSSFFKIPIVVLPRKLYLDKMDDHILELESKDKLDKIAIQLIKQYASCGDDYNLYSHYFNKKRLTEYFYKLIGKYEVYTLNENKETIVKMLNEILDAYKLINSLNSINGYESYVNDSKLQKRINKLK